MELSQESAVPLYFTVAGEIRRDLAEGQVRPGRRLPPARELAAVVGVNHNTMYRALRQLRDEGLLEFRRGRGITWRARPPGGALWSLDVASFSATPSVRATKGKNSIEGL